MCIPNRVIQSRAPKAADKYSRAFNEFHLWTSCYNELKNLPARATTVALYLEHLLQTNSPYSKLESAVYGIRWVHGLYGWESPCEAALVRNILEAGKRTVLKPTLKKEPFTLDMLANLCTRYASHSSNLSDLRVSAICVTASYGFLRFSEVSGLRCCPYSILQRYVDTTKLQLSSTYPLFSRLQYVKETKSYKLRGGVLSYTRTREIVLQALWLREREVWSSQPPQRWRYIGSK